MQTLNSPIDVSKSFARVENTYFFASSVADFNPAEAAGRVLWRRHARKVRTSFGQITLPFEESGSWEFPPREYDQDCELPLKISFVTNRTLRIRMDTEGGTVRKRDSVMMPSDPEGDQCRWAETAVEGGVSYASHAASLKIGYDPMRLEFRDARGNLLTSTYHLHDVRSILNSSAMPFSYVRRSSDMRRCVAASFTLSPGEKLFGCGESFTRLDKRGQKLVLWTTDALGVESKEMYKPVPFFLSDRGYGIFVHSSTPITLDLGHSYASVSTIYLGDDLLDLFLFFGSPKEIVSEYTALTGRAAPPPLWTFGLWMSRGSYESEKEVRNVAERIRRRRLPCDVLHIDTGWFEENWRCDFRFSKSRFADPQRMLRGLKEMGFHVSLWQLPYLTPRNSLYAEAIERGLVVLNADGGLPTQDAVLDFSNPRTLRWYRALLGILFECGVDVIKADFGEAAPASGVYASRVGGFHEHNLYPVRYNQAVAGITEEMKGYSVIWARSAWAGSQRYPVHWGGDSETTDGGMAASLRGGLSLGICGFSFWSHDIGGTVDVCPRDLYARWLAFGMLSSHSRIHGTPPTEPWEYGEDFVETFRRIVELKYRLMPYVYAQATLSCTLGHPLMRPLFFEFPEDRTAWCIEDEYMFGEDILVAPLFHDAAVGRDVYVPDGRWIDYQTGETVEGGKWRFLGTPEVPIVMLVRDGAALPLCEVAQCTGQIDWGTIEVVVADANLSDAAKGWIRFPDGRLQRMELVKSGRGYVFTVNPFEGRADAGCRILGRGRDGNTHADNRANAGDGGR